MGSDYESQADLLSEGSQKGPSRVSFRKAPFIIVVVLLIIGVLIAIAFPVMFMAVAPSLTQTAVTQTKVGLYNISIIEWSWSCADYTACEVCEAYHPQFLKVTNLPFPSRLSC